MRKIHTLLFALGMAFFVTACGAAKVDENRPVEEVRNEAQELSQSRLKATSAAYEKAIAKLDGERTAVKQKLDAIPLLDKMTENARTLRQQYADLTASMEKLAIRKTIYDNHIQK